MTKSITAYAFEVMAAIAARRSKHLIGFRRDRCKAVFLFYTGYFANVCLWLPDSRCAATFCLLMDANREHSTAAHRLFDPIRGRPDIAFQRLLKAQDYHNKVIEFAQTNTNAAFEFVQKLSGVKSPSDVIELSTNHSRNQFETLSEQTKELAALAHKVTLATVEPLKAGVTKAFSQST